MISLNVVFYAFMACSSAPDELFIGHSFFKPFAANMAPLKSAAGLEKNEIEVVFSGGASGAPLALWNDKSNRRTIERMLDGGNVELFAMTYEPEYPTEEGYHNWINAALDSNPNVRFVLALPWLDYPESDEYPNAQAYSDTWHSAHDSDWLALVDALRTDYPDNAFISVPYGQSALELRTLFEADTLPDVDVLTSNLDDASSDNDIGIFVDDKGHPDDILVELGSLVWGSMIYDIEPDESYLRGAYDTDLVSIANAIVEEHLDD